LKAFLAEDHTSFSVLSVSTKHIESTNRISVTLSKNSAKSFYLNQTSKKSLVQLGQNAKKVIDDCLQDAQNCQYFSFFNSKEKKLYTRFLDKVEANFEGQEATQPALFLTLLSTPPTTVIPPEPLTEIKKMSVEISLIVNNPDLKTEPKTLMTKPNHSKSTFKRFLTRCNNMLWLLITSNFFSVE